MNGFRIGICKLCHKKGKFKCEKCKKASYCSRECQFKDWNKHKKYCKYSNILTPVCKKKKMEKHAKIDINSFNIKASRKHRHCQTISIKIKNISSDLEDSRQKKSDDQSDSEDSKDSKDLSNNKDKEKDKTFNFIEKIREILFRKDFNNESNIHFENSSDESISEEKRLFSDEYKNEIIKKLYDLLVEHRNYLIDKVLLKQKRTYYSKQFPSMVGIYYSIEHYIINFILLIKYILYKKDPLSLIRADQALNILGKELFNIKNGLLAYSIDRIFKKFVDVVSSKNVSQNISSIQVIQNILPRFLSLISCIIKLSKVLDDNKMYMKSLSYYSFFYELSLKFINNVKATEKLLLLGNLKFNIGAILIKKKYLNSAINTYKDIITIQKEIDPCSFICGASYYNISIIYYIMDKIKESEIYLNEGLDIINKLINLKSSNRQRDDFRKLIRFFLIFSAELNLNKNDYAKSAQSLKEAIEIIIEDNEINKIRHKTQGNKEKRHSLRYMKYMNNSLSPLYRTSLIRDMSSAAKNKSKNLTTLEQLYEVNFFSNPSDKVKFDENMKAMINGLLDKNSFYYNEVLKKERENNHDIDSQFIKNTNKSFNEDNQKKKEKENTVNDKYLPDLDVKNIVENECIADVDRYTPRDRNRTIARRRRRNIFKEKESEEEKKKQPESNILKLGNELKYITEDTRNKIISYLSDQMIKKKKIIDNEKDISDFKYFFLLLTSLSIRQIEILNETQSTNIPKILYKNLPILFSKQFKNTLNPSQRNMLNKLRVLSLIRCKVLKDADKPIVLDNINYKIFHSEINFDDFKLKQFSQIQEVVREAIESGGTIQKKEENNMHESRIYKKLKSFHISKKMELDRNSFTEGKEDNSSQKSFLKNYIEQKICPRKLEFEHDSTESDEEEVPKSDHQLISNDDVDFKYKNEFDIKKIRLILIQKINKSNKFSEDEKQLYKDIINSGVFIELLNCFDESEIKKFIKDLKTIKEFLRFLINLKLKDNEENENSFAFKEKDKKKVDSPKSPSFSSSSSYSLEVEIDESKLKKDIRRTYNMKKPKFNLDINNNDLSENLDNNNHMDNNNTKKQKHKRNVGFTLKEKLRKTINNIKHVNEIND